MIQQQKKRVKPGFTFLEIMFVVVIIGVLLALVGPRLAGRSERARITATRAQIHNLEQAIRAFHLDNGYFPEQLSYLVDRPSNIDEAEWEPYLDSDVIPRDAWNSEFQYRMPAQNSNKGFDLFSPGPDRQPNTDDDITNWTQERR